MPKPNPNPDTINTNNNINPNPNLNSSNHNHTSRMENSLEPIQLSVSGDGKYNLHGNAVDECRCVENCDHHVSVEKIITVRAVCTDYCWSHVGPTINYQWRLFIGGATANHAYSEHLNLDVIATGNLSTAKLIYSDHHHHHHHDSICSARFTKLANGALQLFI